MRFKNIFFLLMCVGLGLKARGQQIFTLKGVISKQQSAERVPQVLVTNLRTRDIMMSDELGYFAVKTAIGDTLLFTKKDYTTQKAVVTTKNDIPVYMQPIIKLAEVTIKGESKKQEIKDFQKDYARKGVYYDGKPPLASILLNPLNDLHTWFGKDAADLRRFKADSKKEIEFDEVHRRYTIKLVKSVTNTTDSTAEKFMEYYTPSFEDLKEWSDYDLIRHVKKAYDYYDKYKDKLQLQSVNAPILADTNKKSLINGVPGVK